MMSFLQKHSRLVVPAAAFGILYSVLDLVLSRNGRLYGPTGLLVLYSLIPGLVLGAARVMLGRRQGGWPFWQEAALFWGVYLLVLAVSYLLVQGYFFLEWSRGSLPWLVFRWFPQTVYLLCMIPGGIAYHLVGYAGCRRVLRACQ